MKKKWPRLENFCRRRDIFILDQESFGSRQEMEMISYLINLISPCLLLMDGILVNIIITFIELPETEAEELWGRLLKYLIYKGGFLLFVVPLTLNQAELWSKWLVLLCTSKTLQAITRGRLERLNASRSEIDWTDYSRIRCVFLIYSIFFMYLTLLALGTCRIYSISHITILPSPLFWLLFFEPLSIAFETLQAILFHGFQLIDIWLHHSPRNTTNSKILKVLDMAAGLLWERKRIILRDVGFFLDIMSLVMSLGHYMHIWFLVFDDMTFPLVDSLLTLPIQDVLRALLMRIREFIV
ncbi:unnamed protein product [Lactuca saligna]|uniref:Uncharacterized protein n=1 Tax=Lactuca saligna TaxID=75948 RepID=A0AA35YHC7_LACSI|nr:unnamed protein product [Lactuca saligna]